MKRNVQLYVQQDKIDNENCFCLKIYIGRAGKNGYFITAQTNSQDGDGFNIYTFTYNGTDYEIRKGTINNDLDGDAWYVFILGDYGGYYAYSLSDNSNINANCPARNNWSSETWSRLFYTESCSVNRDFYERLELFEDEKILLNCSKQNIDDLQSVFSDFSQSFVVPASAHNNAILEHWYNSEVVTLQDDRLRRKARIEIDLTPFRDGKIQIDKANIKDGNTHSYTLTFFSDLVNLKDKIGEAKLNSLTTISNYAYFDYTLDEVANFIEYDFDQDIAFPLISSKRFWSLGDGGVDDLRDDTTTGAGLYYTELFPAFRVKKIFNEIETKYGINFTGDFIGASNTRFNNLYLWLKNQEINELTGIPAIKTKNQKIIFDVTEDVYFGTMPELIYDSSNDNLRVVYMNNPNLTDYAVQLLVNVLSVTSSDEYVLYVYINDELVSTSTHTNTGQIYAGPYHSVFTDYIFGLNENYKIYIASITNNNIEVQTNIKYTYYASLTNTYVYYDNLMNYTFNIASFKLDLVDYMPDIKIIDFLRGIFKQFNLTCYQTSENNFEIIPLDSWYGNGNLIDITEYSDVTSIDINRVRLPKLTRFDYEKSESFVNRIFFANKGYEYGTVGQAWTFDGDEYTIKLPFEQLRFLSTVDYYATLGYSLKSDVIPPVTTTDLKEYVPKPILLYKYGLSNINDVGARIRMTDGTNNRNVSQVLIFGQDVPYGATDVSLNFSTDESEFLKTGAMPYNSYSMYYESYISNLFALNNRMVSIKANLPLSLLTTLKLNDRLIIKGKRYIINDYQADLTTGDLSLNLLLDFRDLTSFGWQDDPEQFPPDEVG